MNSINFDFKFVIAICLIAMIVFILSVRTKELIEVDLSINRKIVLPAGKRVQAVVYKNNTLYYSLEEMPKEYMPKVIDFNTNSISILHPSLKSVQLVESRY